MNHCTGCKKRTVLLCIFMICVQLIGMTGCAARDLVSFLKEPVIDNDLVVDVDYEDITFKVGELWVPVSNEEGMYFYPDTDIVYYVSCYGTFSNYVIEENYFPYVIEYLRDHEILDKVTVIEKMTPYVTADEREAYISRLHIKESNDGIEICHDADLVIIPKNKYFALFSVVYGSDENVPLDIREVVDTATFDLGPLNAVEGLSFYDEGSNSAVEFTDSENFVTYMDADNRDVYYAYGTYSVYMGEEAIEQVSGMKEYGLTKEEIEYGMPSNSFDNFIALVFDIKGYVDEDGNDNENEFTALYIGTYDEENGVMDMLNCSTISFYHWVKEEVE